MTWQLVVLCIQLLSWTMLLPLCFLGGSILLGLTRRKNKMTREDFLTYFCFLNIFVDENCQEKLEAQVLQPTFTFSIFRNKLIISLISGSKIFFFHFCKKNPIYFASHYCWIFLAINVTIPWKSFNVRISSSFMLWKQIKNIIRIHSFIFNLINVLKTEMVLIVKCPYHLLHKATNHNTNYSPIFLFLFYSSIFLIKPHCEVLESQSLSNSLKWFLI